MSFPSIFLVILLVLRVSWRVSRESHDSAQRATDASLPMQTAARLQPRHPKHQRPTRGCQELPGTYQEFTRILLGITRVLLDYQGFARVLLLGLSLCQGGPHENLEVVPRIVVR